MNAQEIIERINDGGKSGSYLREAVLSLCSDTPFKGSLSYFVSLDNQGHKSFLDIVRYKTTSGWRESTLLEILHETE